MIPRDGYEEKKHLCIVFFPQKNPPGVQQHHQLPDKINTYGLLHQTAAEPTLFSSSYGTFTKIGHNLRHKRTFTNSKEGNSHNICS